MEYTIATSNGAVGGSPDRVEAITCLVGVSPRCFSRILDIAGLPFVGLSWFWHVGFHLRAHARFPVHRDLIAVVHAGSGGTRIFWISCTINLR